MNLRQAMYERIQTFSFSNIDKFSTAGLVTRMTTDVMNVQQAFQMSIRICVRAPIMLVSAMIWKQRNFCQIYPAVKDLFDPQNECKMG